MSDLTAATGLTKGSIYGNFKDKNDVAVHAFQHNIDLIFRLLHQGTESSRLDTGKIIGLPARLPQNLSHDPFLRRMPHSQHRGGS
jgi:TetR/AcrR family transcriptional repressor of nem operon